MSITKNSSLPWELRGLLYAALFIGASIELASFVSAKIYLRSLYSPDFSHTFYCEVPFDKNGVALACPQGWSDEDCKIEWDHVVPASLLAHNLPCSQKHTCAFNPEWSRRKCCQETSTEFSFREANISNLMPALRRVNREKSNYLPGITQPHKRLKKLCGMKIDSKKKSLSRAIAGKGGLLAFI